MSLAAGRVGWGGHDGRQAGHGVWAAGREAAPEGRIDGSQVRIGIGQLGPRGESREALRLPGVRTTHTFSGFELGCRVRAGSSISAYPGHAGRTAPRFGPVARRPLSTDVRPRGSLLLDACRKPINPYTIAANL